MLIFIIITLSLLALLSSPNPNTGKTWVTYRLLIWLVKLILKLMLLAYYHIRSAKSAVKASETITYKNVNEALDNASEIVVISAAIVIVSHSIIPLVAIFTTILYDSIVDHAIHIVNTA